MTEIIGSSKFKPNNGYGENGDANASSLLPGQQPHRNSRLLDVTKANTPAVAKQAAAPDIPDWQTRNVSASPIKTTPGMRNPNAHPAKVPATSRPVSKPAPR